jgi:predicted CXXCH cytochrome family protein
MAIWRNNEKFGWLRSARPLLVVLAIGVTAFISLAAPQIRRVKAQPQTPQATAPAPPSARPQAPAAPPAKPQNSCLDCHSVLDAPLGISEQKFARDIHAQKGLGCADCHGGDPSSDDPNVSMDPKKGFRGKPKRTDIPKLCAGCHSNADYMRKYDPRLRTDQLSQYVTSVHGKLLAKGDTKVAVCIDCHSVHGIVPARDPQSTVHPLNVATTCSRCHADANYMKPYKIPTDQFAGYNASVHHAAMVERGDLSAPSCVTCHGNHGAAPPGVASVQNVCSTCHVFQAQLFAASVHKPAFDAASLPGCVTCHGNHRINSPNDDMLGVGPKAVCTNCHSDGDPGFVGADKMHKSIADLAAAIQRSDDVLGRAERSGMEVSQARLDESQARDALLKARVTIHAFKPAAVDQDVAPGLKIAESTRIAGEKALAEREYRRKGLALSVFAVLFVILGLWLFMRDLESRPGAKPAGS